MSDTSRRWWTWPRVLFAVWSVVLTNWVTFALSHHSPWWMYPVMWSVVIVMAIVAVLGEVIYQTRRTAVQANPLRSRDVGPVVPPDVDPVRRQEPTEVLIFGGGNGAVPSPRHRVSSKPVQVSHGTQYTSLHRSEPEETEPVKVKKPKREVGAPKPTDVPSVSELSLSKDPKFQHGRRVGWYERDAELESDDPPADGTAEDRP